MRGQQVTHTGSSQQIDYVKDSKTASTRYNNGRIVSNNVYAVGSLLRTRKYTRNFQLTFSYKSKVH